MHRQPAAQGGKEPRCVASLLSPHLLPSFASTLGVLTESSLHWGRLLFHSKRRTYSSDSLENDFLHRNRNTYKYLGDDTENLNTSAILSRFARKKYSWPSSSWKATCWNITSNRRFQFIGTQLITRLSSYWNKKKLCKTADQGARTKIRRYSLNSYSLASDKLWGLSFSDLGSHCWQRPGWPKCWAAEQTSAPLGHINANFAWGRENTPKIQTHACLPQTWERGKCSDTVVFLNLSSQLIL